MIGKLRHRITIEEATETRDDYGAPEPTWETFAEVWASVESLSGREYFVARSSNSEVTHRVTIRYLSGLSPIMRIVYDSRVFEIVSILDRPGREKYLEVLCNEAVDVGGYES